jgi:hypothetical protein
MATIGRVSGASFLNTPRLQYITTATFYDYFYTYTTSLTASLDTVGTLTIVDGAGPTTCPAGRVLRENGRKLYPGANPGITTYMVGVYDQETFLNGFIDPNAQVFQIYNTDKPNYLADGVEPTLGTTDRGPSIYTRGDVLGGGDLDISGNARINSGLVVYGGSQINGGELVSGGLTVYNRLSLATSVIIPQSGASDRDLDCSLANVFVITINANNNFTLTASNMSSGQMIYVLYNNAGGNTPTVTMGTGIRGYYSGSEQPITFSGTLSITQQFIAISGKLCELSRMFIAAS